MTQSSSTQRQTPAPFGHAPALDGLRGLAVVAVLFYHAHFSFATGGFIGVSVFFTLSGFLITSLLLREFHTNDRVDLKRFWGRRFRRLLPASYVTIAAVIIMAAAGVWDGDQLRSLHSDVPGALGQVLNWVFIAKGTSYAGATTAPSPLTHYWSLAIEEQFYLFFPFLVALMLRAARGRRWPLATLMGAMVLASATWNHIAARDDINRAYFGLDTRLFELVIGALLAVAMLYRLRVTHLWARLSLNLAAVAALGVLVGVAMNATVTTTWMYPWGFVAVSTATAVIVAAGMQRSWFSSVMGCLPLRWVGTISYGLYLYHWPIYQWLTPRRTGLSPWPLLGVRLALTVAIAVVSYVVIEQPIRRGTLLRGRQLGVGLAAAMVVLLIGNVAATFDPPAAEQSLVGLTSSTTAPPPPPQRVLIVGDETAASLATVSAVNALAERNVILESLTFAGCGVSVGGTRHVTGQDLASVNPPSCAEAPAAWQAKVASMQPDVVIVMSGFWDVTDRQFWSEDPIRAPGEQVFDDFLATEMFTRTDELAGGGATVMWATMAPQRRVLPGVDAPASEVAENAPLRATSYNLRVDEVTSSDDRTGALDLGAQITALSADPYDPTVRPDGASLSASAAVSLSGWVADQIEGITRTVQSDALGDAAMVDPLDLAALPPAPPWTQLERAGNEKARIMVVGDSVAFGLGWALEGWGTSTKAATFLNRGQFNCPIARGGSYRFQQEVAEYPGRCDWAEPFNSWVAASRPHEVVIFDGVWDIVDRILPGDRKWRHLGDPVVDEYFLREMLTAIDLLSSQGAIVTLLTHHYIESGTQKGYSGLPESEHARVDRYNQLLQEAAGLRPGVVRVVDLAGWIQSQPGGALDPAKLKDGLHFSDEYLGVIAEWLGPQLVAQLG